MSTKSLVWFYATRLDIQGTIGHGLFEYVRSSLDTCKYEDTVDTFQNMMLVQDTGDLSALELFKPDVIDYMECDIPVKDVSNIKRLQALEQPYST